jgi:hypothetical protein
MGNVLLLPGDQHQVEDRVDRQVRFTTDEPGGRVVGAANRGDCKCSGMNAEFQFLAIAALQDVQVQRHTVDPSNERSNAAFSELPGKRRELRRAQAA